MEPWSALQQIAVSLTESLRASDRYERLLAAVRAAIPCDATALLALHDGVLVPLAAHGLSSQVLGMRFRPADHPRLAAVVASTRPVRFPADSGLADPFDGLVLQGLAAVHDCLGCPLVADGKVVGVLTADALAVGAFDRLDEDFLGALGALAGATLQTAHLIETIEALAERRAVVVRELTRDSSPMLGVSPAMELVRREIDAVATTDFSVLVLGETGVGKELAARAIHDGSRRREAPFIQVNCAALPEGVVESELFGHVRGAFTGAIADRPGKFELADGGTLFLDEIGEMPLAVQAKLLRALQEGEVQRVGADKPVRVNVRIVAATNRDLVKEMAAGRFRADLYHRLSVFPLVIPPLRDRRGDVPVIAGFFIDRYRVQLGLPRVVLTEPATAQLAAAAWPGNVRELDHVLARAVLRASTRTPSGSTVRVEASDLDPTIAPAPADVPSAAPLPRRVASGELPLKVAVDELKRTVIMQTLLDTRGSWAAAARQLGMDRSNLHNLARRLGIEGVGSVAPQPLVDAESIRR
jgi:anaerobic nitric oxide reductase transcription regulator